MFKRVSIVFAALAVLLVGGCSKAPEMEMNNATTSMQAAQTAEAEQYAPDAYKMAQDTLAAANAAKTEQDSKFSLFRSYGASKALFASAQTLADKAKADAEAEKERVHQEVTGMLTETQAAIDAATAALSKAPRGKGTKADIEMIKNDLAGVKTAFDDAKADFDGGKYLVAKTKLQTVKAKADSITNEIATAAARKAGK